MIKFRGRCKPHSMIEGLIHIENAEEGHEMLQTYRGVMGTWTFQPDTPDAMVPAVFPPENPLVFNRLEQGLDRLEQLIRDRGYIK